MNTYESPDEVRARAAEYADRCAKARAKAVIVCAGEHGWVIHCRGHWLELEVDGDGPHVHDLGLPSPHTSGVKVWEGDYYWYGDGTDADINADGTYREPTDAEWEAVKAGRNPFLEASK